MKDAIKKLRSCLIISVIFTTILFVQQNNYVLAEVKSEQTADTEKVLVFLRDVVGYDFTKYQARLTTNRTTYWSWMGGVALTTGQYVLDATNALDDTGNPIPSILSVNFIFWDEHLGSITVNENSQGPPLYSVQPSADLKEVSASFLQRYQICTRDSQVTQMKDVLGTVDIASNSTVLIENLEFTVQVENDRTLLTWGNVLNGSVYSRLHLEFRNGNFSGFGDNRSYTMLGSNEVNISEQEAVGIALDYLKTFSYTYRGEKVADFNVVEKHIQSRISFLNKTQFNVLYPIWLVDLPLNYVYPGSVSHFNIMLWADSGEVVKCLPLGYGSSPDYTSPSNQNPISSPENTSDSNDPVGNSINPQMIIIMAVVGVASAISIAIVALKKKPNTK